MSEDFKIKEYLFKQCHELLQVRLERLNTKILDLQESLSSETKSSAGDKHETGRAMIHLEREKLGYQLAEIEQNLKTLERINPVSQHVKVGLGSVVFTTQFNYFIAVSCGQISSRGTDFYAVSLSSPIARHFMSKEQEDCVTFRSQKITILKIL
jgi:transcription elongation GreA/GreB family factor